MSGAAILTKSMVIAELTKSGQVGRTTITQDAVLSQITVEKSINTTKGLYLNKRLVVGETYFVNFDGVEYACECKVYNMNSAQCAVYIGDFLGYMKKGESTGEPFTLYEQCYISDGSFISAVLGFIDNGTHTASVYQKTETIHPIDPKFIVLTSPSGKKFNLTVDDSGTITATEVV